MRMPDAGAIEAAHPARSLGRSSPAPLVAAPAIGVQQHLRGGLPQPPQPPAGASPAPRDARKARRDPAICSAGHLF